MSFIRTIGSTVISLPIHACFTASPEEVEKSRFSPRLLQILRKNLGMTQKELATLAGVSIGAVQLWEKGKFRPKEDKMAVFVGLRKLGSSGVRKLLEDKAQNR